MEEILDSYGTFLQKNIEAIRKKLETASVHNISVKMAELDKEYAQIAQSEADRILAEYGAMYGEKKLYDALQRVILGQ
jgi:predicted Zn-dependent protease